MSPETPSEPQQAVPNPPEVTPSSNWLKRIATRRNVIAAGSSAAVVLVVLILIGSIFYLRYARLIDKRLAGGTFRDSVNIYAAPLTLTVSDPLSVEDLVAELQTAGYEENEQQTATRKAGSYRKLTGGTVEVLPADSGARRATVVIAEGQIARILVNGKDVRENTFGSPLITTLSSRKEQRLLVSFDGIPPVLVKAIVSAEDKRFFQHGGLDLPRIAKAAFVDVKDHRKEEGASTLTMQLVRGLWLEPDKLWRRKLAEAMMTIHLEHQWTKKKIFETYVNEVYLGRQADYSVHGFGQGARMFFGKNLEDITLPEAALLAGLVQRPSYFNPFRSPDRAKERRDLVLTMMRENRYITPAEFENATAEPVRVAGSSLSEARAPYFLDLVNEEVQARQSEDPESADEAVRTVYSTIDLNLQRAADEAVNAGMQEVDKLLAKRPGKPGPKAEAALIALDPKTGEIRALVGGRDYARSQLNRILAKRPPGSVFKPFVYATALNTAISGASQVYTPSSMVDDSPTTFWSGGKAYQPGNFHGEIFGRITLRQALAKSDNVAAVKVAQGVGYGAVVQMARRAGLNNEIQATPAVALGAYQVTPLEMAGAYTVFANGGMWVKPVVISSFRGVDDRVIAGAAPETHEALDPRVNWLMVSMLEEVMRSGTAAGVRSRGFILPAAGKTGTSHDGWFAGFTSRLLCIVWVGFDDYRELNLEGAKSALPIWTEFMKRASKMGAYRNAREFPSPAGIIQIKLCVDSGKLAGDDCPNTRSDYFIEGSEPQEKCDLHRSPIVQAIAVTDTDPEP
jgi:penicillin-binding protein 1B